MRQISQWKRPTRPIDPEVATALVASDRWQSRVSIDQETGCHLWQSTKSSAGYGVIGINYQTVYTHRLAKVAALGRDIDRHMVIDHLCRNRLCCNPDHLDVVTDQENLLRQRLANGTGPAATHCIRGHELTGDNLVAGNLKLGMRSCRTCAIERSKQTNALIVSAAKSLGLLKKEYVSEYGWSAKTARRVLEARG